MLQPVELWCHRCRLWTPGDRNNPGLSPVGGSEVSVVYSPSVFTTQIALLLHCHLRRRVVAQSVFNSVQEVEDLTFVNEII